jgi:hypothetical protein
MESQDFLHFDAHFLNILTDGSSLYLSDFGLAMSKKFSLTSVELDFFNNHQSYDRCLSSFCFVRYIINTLPKTEKDDFRSKLNSCLYGEYDDYLSPAALEIIKRYGVIAQEMEQFRKELKMDVSKKISYPKDKIENLLSTLEIKVQSRKKYHF